MKFLLKIMLFIIILQTAWLNLFSQKEAYNWCFGGNTGITFNTADGIPIQMNTKNTDMTVCTSISDENGNLILYGFANNIYNKYSEVIKTGIFHPVIILPVINQENNYYVICDEKIFIVDINLNNGKGKIVKEINNIIDIDGRRLSAVYHRNGKDIWLATYKKEGDFFEVFLIDEFGIKLHNIDTFARKDSIHSYSDNYYNNSPGEPIKFSPDGKRIGVNYCHIGIRLPYTRDMTEIYGVFEIYNFNDSTGIISNPITVKTKFLYPEHEWALWRGFEFSPNSKYVYVFGKQYDVSYLTEEDILKSEYVFHEVPDWLESLTYEYQLGPDGKIYLSDQKQNDGFDRINVIHDPNEKGVMCFFDSRGGPQNTNTCDLPMFITSWFKFEIKASNNSKVCENDQLELYATDRLNGNYTWTGPNGFESYVQDPIISNAKPEMSGWYYVTAKRRHDEISSDSTFVTVIPKPDCRIIPSDSIAKCEFAKITLTVSNDDNNFIYKWSTNDSTELIEVINPGTYYLTVTDTSTGCASIDSVKVYIKDIKPEITIIGNNPGCHGDTVLLRTTEEYAKYDWSSGDTTREITVTKSANFTVSVIDSIGCFGTSDEVGINIYSIPKTILKGTDRVCIGAEERYTINKTSKDTVLWEIEGGIELASFGTDTILIKWNRAGAGRVIVKQVSNKGCVGKDTIDVFVVDDLKPTILPEQKVICGNNPLTLYTADKYGNYEWSTGDTTESIIVNNEGIYWLKVRDIAGCEGADTVFVKKANEPIPQITGNPYLCNGETTILSLSDTYRKYLWNTGDTNKTIEVNTTGTYSVEVTDSNGCKGSASIEVKEIVINISGMKDIDFGRINISTSTEQSITLQSKTKEDILLYRIFTIFGTNEFDITTTPSLPHTLKANETIEVKLIFNPKQLQLYVDSLIIEITEPCDMELSGELKGIGKAEMLVSLPDISIEIGDSICIPLTAKLLTTTNEDISTEFNATIAYESSAFYPEIPFNKSGENIEVRFNSKEMTINNTDKVITELCGEVMLPNQKLTELSIKEFSTINPYLDIETKNGTLITNACMFDIRKVVFKESFDLVIFPNPAEDEIKLLIHSKDNIDFMEIRIYDSQGIEVYDSKFKSELFAKEVIINTTEFTNGLYQINFYLDNTIIDSKSVIIFK